MTLIACLGEPLVVLYPLHGSCVESAAHLQMSEGGAELNVAIHLSRLGRQVRLIGAVGADAFGLRLTHRLEAEGVDHRWLVTDPEAPTGAYVKETTERGTRTLYLRSGSATSRLSKVPDGALEGVTHLHVSGITPALSDGCDAMTAALLRRPRTERPHVFFDVNHRPALWSDDVAPYRLLELSRGADTVFVGLDEAARLWGCHDAEQVHQLMPDCPELVVKDSDRPATAFTGGLRFEQPTVARAVVDAVGAGDAFAAGYVHARAAGVGPDGALRAGHMLAASVLVSVDDLGAALPDGTLDEVLGGVRK